MTATATRGDIKKFLEKHRNVWLSGVEIREMMGYQGPQKTVSNGTSGLHVAGLINKRKREGGGRVVIEFQLKTRQYKKRETQQEALPLNEVETVHTAPTTQGSLMSPEFEILSTSLGKIMADNNNMRAALITCRDAINKALQG